MEIFGRGLSVQDEGQTVCRGSPALGGERGGRYVWGCCEHHAPRSYGEEDHRRARGARKEPTRRARGERARRARRRRAKSARDTAFAGTASRSVRGVRFMPTRVRRALDGTLDPARRAPSANSRVRPKRSGRPSAMARAISRRTMSAHDTRPASAPDAEAPPGSGSGGGRDGHDPNGMGTHVRLQGVKGRSHKAGTFAPMFPGKATENLARDRSWLPARGPPNGVRDHGVVGTPGPQWKGP
jgi:hypothetical protein